MADPRPKVISPLPTWPKGVMDTEEAEQRKGGGGGDPAIPGPFEKENRLPEVRGIRAELTHKLKRLLGVIVNRIIETGMYLKQKPVCPVN